MIPFVLLLIGFANCAQYLGCFSDNAINWAPGPQRDLPNLQTAQTQYSVDQCIATCASKNFFYAGVQNAHECYCGNSYGNYCLGLGATTCKSTCTANSSEICGGVNYNSIYVALPGGPAQNSSCVCGTPVSGGGCAYINSTTTAFGCATAQDATTLDFTLSSTGGAAGTIKYSLNSSSYTTNTNFSISSQGTIVVQAVDSLGASFPSTTVYVGPAKVVGVLPTAYVPYGTLAGYRTSSPGASDATVASTAGNGTAPYKYTLYPASSGIAYTGTPSGSFSGLPAGSYNLIATDSTGCRSTPVSVVVYNPTLADPPTGINATDIGGATYPSISATWIAPVNNGYTPITGYSVKTGYFSAQTQAIVWNAAVNFTTTSAAISDQYYASTRRFIQIATINAVGIGAYSSMLEFQAPCGAGSFANSTTCQGCAPGTSTNGFVGRSFCRTCQAGSYSPGSQANCMTCQGNTFSDSGAAACTQCSAGYITGGYYCQPCAPGTYNPGTNPSNTICFSCPANTYSSDPAASACLSCPSGQTSVMGSSVCKDASGYKK